MGKARNGANIVQRRLDHRAPLVGAKYRRIAGNIQAWILDVKRRVLAKLIMDGPEEWDLHPDAFGRHAEGESNTGSGKHAA